MRLNGESIGQMEHVKAIKAAGGVSPNPDDGNDTSQDQRWEYDESKTADRYVLATTILWMAPKLILLAPFMLLTHIPVMCVCRLYIALVPDNTDRLHRSTCFVLIAILCFVLSAPCAVVIIISYAGDCLAYWLFGILYCTFSCRWGKLSKSFETINPYRNGPSVVRHLPDFLVAVMGQVGRQSSFETWYMVCCMWLLMPWLKYYVCCNPWVYDLEHRMVQQISTEMQDIGTPNEVADTARKIISQARQPRDAAHHLDIWSFVPHYPYPPPDRRWALGLQAGGSTYPGKFTLIVHTTHAISEAKGCTEQFVLSNSCEQPIYRVMLWYNNPFHFLTGWVEASVSTGKPSQPLKYHGGEHPMWLVTAKTRQVSGRDSFSGSGMIDAFFDYWLPVFVHEMRRLSFSEKYKAEGYTTDQAHHMAKMYADAHYVEVESKDGASVPKSMVGRNLYNKADALTDFEKIAKLDGNGKSPTTAASSFTDHIMALATTGLGREIGSVIQGRDLHEQGSVLDRATSLAEKIDNGLEDVEKKVKGIR